MITQTYLLFLTCSYLLIISLHAYPSCTPSACGTIPNISFPFRLQGDPKQCADDNDSVLACENNATFLSINSHRYRVKEINYQNDNMRLANASINISSICSFPMPSAFAYSDPYRFFDPDCFLETGTQPINFLSCPYPLHNTSLLTRVTDCDRHTYIRVGHMQVQDVDSMCTVDAVVPTSWNFTDMDNVSLSEIHQSLLYGFEMNWIRFICRKCRGRGCGVWPDGLVGIFSALLFAGVTIPAKIIIGFGISSWILVKDYYWTGPVDPFIIVVFSFGVFRFTVGIICAMGFLIYKFRRRHLSMYDAIEGFLQSDNKLLPIRYSYSDIKKMTRGFQEKQGEGGFGSVYKGKLQSGHDVAVKVLGNPKADGQDFINEIATIGRIHHVNVVKLVGYCVERSKHALIFYFMSNGSLEKYICTQEEIDCLDWDMKFMIAVGVARGIEYLHCGCDIEILHFDIKPHNRRILTMARGTIGYVAPELINRSIGGVSNKADVYSFGMLLMEMVGLNRDLIGHNDDSSKYFPYWIYDHFNQGTDIEIKAGKNNVNDEDDSGRRLVRKMTIVALWCIQMRANDRLSMNKVLEMLEGDIESLKIPDYPSQSIEIAVNVEQTGTTFSTDDSISLLRDNDAPIASALLGSTV
ncbi:hypothetical protein C2S52_005610 [Perilla frutescens var. hirtella]|nr:hypothetical protein C2S52_005610 [Perilla frutescens var. hirtella]